MLTIYKNFLKAFLLAISDDNIKFISSFDIYNPPNFLPPDIYLSLKLKISSVFIGSSHSEASANS